MLQHNSFAALIGIISAARSDPLRVIKIYHGMLLECIILT